MEGGWSQFRGFEGRSKVILLTIHAKQFISMAKIIQEEEGTEFHLETAQKRLGAFEKFFDIFINIFTDKVRREYENILECAKANDYKKIDSESLSKIQTELELFNTDLKKAQSRDVELIKAM